MSPSQFPASERCSVLVEECRLLHALGRRHDRAPRAWNAGLERYLDTRSRFALVAARRRVVRILWEVAEDLAGPSGVGAVRCAGSSRARSTVR
jgi:hypothetical protein